MMVDNGWTGLIRDHQPTGVDSKPAPASVFRWIAVALILSPQMDEVLVLKMTSFQWDHHVAGRYTHSHAAWNRVPVGMP